MNSKPALLISMVLLCGSVQAAGESPVYVTIDGGQTRIKNTTANTYSAAGTVSAIIGFRFADTPYMQSSIEAQYTQTIEKESATIGGTPTDYKEETLGLYLAAATVGDAYLRARVGAVDHRVTTDTVVTYDAIKLAAGIGFGFRVNNGQFMEVNYTQIGSDVSTISVGFRF